MTHVRHMNLVQRVVSVLMLAVVLMTSAPISANAQTFVTSTIGQTDIVTQNDASDTGFIVPAASIKNTEVAKAKADVLKTYVVPMTAYTSAVEECDDTPFTAADGTRTYDGMVASNFLPFGTKIRIPSVYGDKIFTVHDRMNDRYGYRVDVWHEIKADAKQFGLKKAATIEVIEWGTGKTSWNKKITRSNVQVAVK